MKTFSALLLALAAVGAKGQCQGDSHDDVHNALRDAYERAGFGAGPWSCQLDAGVSMNCYGLNPYAYSTSAIYTHRPRSLTIISNHFFILTGIPNPGLPPSAPWTKESDFTTRCLDSFGDILAEIRKNNPKPVPSVPTPRPTNFPTIWFPPAITLEPSFDGMIPPIADFDECANSFEEITFMNAKGAQRSTTCRALGEGRARKMKRLCNKNEYVIAKCPGLCRTKDSCKCTNNPWEFRVSATKRMRCSELANLGENQKAKKCRKSKFKLQCPGICKERCGAKSEEPAPSTLHADIIEKLDAVFGDENCLLDEEGLVFTAQNRAGYYCTIDVRGFSAVGEYYWKKEEDSTESPDYLGVSYSYPNGISGKVMTIFENDICGLACFDEYFNAIVANTAFPGEDAVDTPNNSSSSPVASPSQTPNTAAPTVSPIVVL